MKEKHVIMGVHVTDRLQRAEEVQRTLSEFGEHIKTRLGLHEVEDGRSSPNGLILLEFVGDDSRCAEMTAKLAAIGGVEVKTMVFDHPA